MTRIYKKDDLVRITLMDGNSFIGVFLYEEGKYFKIHAPWLKEFDQGLIFNQHTIRKVDKIPPQQLLTSKNEIIRDYIRKTYFQGDVDD